MFNINYPPDYFYPFNIILVPIITVIVFFLSLGITHIIVQIYETARKEKKKFVNMMKGQTNNEETSGKDAPKWKTTEVMITLAATVGTLFGSGIYTIIQFPLLDYYVVDTTDSASVKSNSFAIGTFDIIIKNLGISAAKNVSTSVHVTDATFKSLYSTPYLPGSFKTDMSSNNGYVKINLLPSNFEIKITAEVNATNSLLPHELTPFVFSDEGIAKFRQGATILFYILLIIILVLLYLILVYVIKLNNIKKKITY